MGMIVALHHSLDRLVPPFVFLFKMVKNSIGKAYKNKKREKKEGSNPKDNFILEPEGYF
jgi:hypothetical protein